MEKWEKSGKYAETDAFLRRIGLTTGPAGNTQKQANPLGFQVSWQAEGGSNMQKTVINQVCMYCKALYGQKDGRGVTGESHGICPLCAPYSRAVNGCRDLKNGTVREKAQNFIKLVWQHSIETRGRLPVKFAEKEAN